MNKSNCTESYYGLFFFYLNLILINYFFRRYLHKGMDSFTFYLISYLKWHWCYGKSHQLQLVWQFALPLWSYATGTYSQWLCPMRTIKYRYLIYLFFFFPLFCIINLFHTYIFLLSFHWWLVSVYSLMVFFSFSIWLYLIKNN